MQGRMFEKRRLMDVKSVGDGECVKRMAGASLPTVVSYEDCRHGYPDQNQGA